MSFRPAAMLCVSLAAMVVAAVVSPRPARAGLIVPEYQSFPGAAGSFNAVNLVLDFDGDQTATYGSYTPGVTPAYSIDDDLHSFSGEELDNIYLIWQSVSEKYSPFNINVSTFATGMVNEMRIVIGGDGGWLGKEAGGVSALTAYMNPGLANLAFVFPDHLGGGNPKYVAEAAAHEAGHAFGLKHQSLYDSGGNKIEEYNPGDAEKAPIMGISYAAKRALWWRGSNPDGATQIQDDLERLSRFGTQQPNFGYRADDHGGTLAAASPLALDAQFTLSGYGIIGQTSDADFFSFTTPGGLASIIAEVAPFGAMLDLSMSLYDTAGNLLASRATASLGERIDLSLEAGTYAIGITSAGHYGDVGQYFISGSAVPEPASVAVILLGIGGALRRRRVR